MKPIRLLLIEDDHGAAQALEHALQSEGYVVTLAQDGDEGLQKALADEFDVVITDLRMPGLSGLEIVRQLHESKPRLPIVLTTAFGTTDNIIQATRHGAFEFLSKPFEIEELLELTNRAAHSARLMSGPVVLGGDPEEEEAIIGSSRVMQNVYKEIGRVAATSVTVLIRGETGTGKELVARAIYQYSDRSPAPFIAVNCAAIPEGLLESELFGHEKGAFTGADRQRIGRLEQAHQGTLFLDEIGDMSHFTQAKLLRVLQEKTIERVGGKESIPVDVRIIAATHRDLEKAIQEDRFREDLFYRLAGVVILLPPLRDRVDDIPLLTRFFLARFGGELSIQEPKIQEDAAHFLQLQPWPGNVRQLGNILRQALLMAAGFPISLANVRAALTPPSEAGQQLDSGLPALIEEALRDAEARGTGEAYDRVMENVERLLFQRAMEMTQGNQSKAARWLGVSRQTLRDKLRRYGLDGTSEGPPADDSPDG